VEVLHAFLTSALDWGEWPASRPCCFTSRERAPGTHWIGGWVGPRAVLDTVVKRKIPTSRQESNPRTTIVQPMAWLLYQLSYYGSSVLELPVRICPRQQWLKKAWIRMLYYKIWRRLYVRLKVFTIKTRVQVFRAVLPWTYCFISHRDPSLCLRYETCGRTRVSIV
jgi:hypothetical protein